MRVQVGAGRVWRRLAWVAVTTLVLALVAPATGAAQSVLGSIRGTVTDTGGGVIPKAPVLITDETNPRAVAFQSARLVRHIDALPREKSYPFASREQQFVTRLSADLQLADIFEMATVMPPGRRTALEARLLEWSQSLRDISDALAWHYFSHTQFSRADTIIRRGPRQ